VHHQTLQILAIRDEEWLGQQDFDHVADRSGRTAAVLVFSEQVGLGGSDW
jgi:hypothetical protein